MSAFLIAFLIGFFTKFTDLMVDDGLKIANHLELFTGFIYGALISIIIAIYPLLAPLAIAIVISLIFTRKIDHPAHYTGIGTMILFSSIFGISPVNITYLVIFLVAGSIDEIANDLADKGKIKGRLNTFFSFRLTLEVTTFLVSLITNVWIMFFGLLSFDVSYNVTSKLGEKLRKI